MWDTDWEGRSRGTQGLGGRNTGVGRAGHRGWELGRDTGWEGGTQSHMHSHTHTKSSPVSLTAQSPKSVLRGSIIIVFNTIVSLSPESTQYLYVHVYMPVPPYVYIRSVHIHTYIQYRARVHAVMLADNATFTLQEPIYM